MPILPDTLFRHAAASPETPWLFYAEGLDWRWLSWGEAARRVTAGAEAFASLPRGTRVEFPYRPTPEAVLHDLAIQVAGHVPMPLVEAPHPLTPSPIPSHRPGEGEIQTGEWGRPSPGGVGGDGRGDGGEGSAGAVDTLGVLVRGRDGEWLEWSDDDLRAAIEAVAREVAPAGPPAGGREILVSGRSLAEPEERAVLAWALDVGAALLLEPDPLSYVPTAAWARPTFFHGTAADLAALRRLADTPPGPLARLLRRPPGLPFGRLRVVLYLKEGRPSPLSPDDESFWRGRGVRVAPLPQCGTNACRRGI